jgi:hypothetical protein
VHLIIIPSLKEGKKKDTLCFPSPEGEGWLAGRGEVIRKTEKEGAPFFGTSNATGVARVRAAEASP